MVGKNHGMIHLPSFVKTCTIPFTTYAMHNQRATQTRRAFFSSIIVTVALRLSCSSIYHVIYTPSIFILSGIHVPALSVFLFFFIYALLDTASTSNAKKQHKKKGAYVAMRSQNDET